ncbi:MAG: winged helix DNA-binding domain-containing protein [Chloroflexi bacterium]|nr:winged helix DNA-binding domain-containing protein [Chloroflexota bacterium]
MPDFTLARQRLCTQQLSAPTFDTPEAVVDWLCAVQSQDYTAAKWAVGMRGQGFADAAVEQAFTEGTILRTHVMRPTWHFVARDDIRWMLELTAPRVHQLSAYYNRQLELDDALFVRSDALLGNALRGGNQLTRAELSAVLEQAGITTNDLRATYIVGHAELEGILCSGGRRGKQFTYALIDERAPAARRLSRDEALAELTRRYFFSHGPATIQDFVWWSGLTVADAKAGLDSVCARLIEEVIDGVSYWLSDASADSASGHSAYLLSNYDEYVVGYTDRSALYAADSALHALDPRGNFLFSHTIVVDNQIVGTWKRTFKKNEVVIAPKFLAPLSTAQERAFMDEARRFGEFVGLAVKIQ